MKDLLCNKGSSIRLKTNSSLETMDPKRQCDNIVKMLKGKKTCQLKFLHLARNKIFPDKQKFEGKFIASRSALQEILKGANP